jgi:hypothetical protein
MTDEQADLLGAKCRACFTTLCLANVNEPPPRDIDLFIEGFWAGVEEQTALQKSETLASVVDLEAARAIGLIK